MLGKRIKRKPKRSAVIFHLSLIHFYGVSIEQKINVFSRFTTDANRHMFFIHRLIWFNGISVKIATINCDYIIAVSFSCTQKRHQKYCNSKLFRSIVHNESVEICKSWFRWQRTIILHRERKKKRKRKIIRCLTRSNYTILRDFN